MKKNFFILSLMIVLSGFGIMANAQVCKISETGDNVEVFSAVIEDGNTVVVTVGNDSQNNSANVTVTVEVTYKSPTGSATHNYSYTGKIIAKPNQESIVRIRIPESDRTGYKPIKVKVTKIEGTKCM